MSATAGVSAPFLVGCALADEGDDLQTVCVILLVVTLYNLVGHRGSHRPSVHNSASKDGLDVTR